MLTLQKTTALDKEYLESLGFVWHTDSDETSYISDELVVISEAEAEAIMKRPMNSMTCISKRQSMW